MERIGHKMLLASIRTTREEVLRELADLSEEEFKGPTATERRAQVQKLLLRFGDHMREHANQIMSTRFALQGTPKSTALALREAELAWGALLGALVNLSDEDLRRRPPDGNWSIEEILQHILASERRSLEAIRAARRPVGK